MRINKKQTPRTAFYEKSIKAISKAIAHNYKDQQEFCRAFGLSPSNFCKYKFGNVAPSLDLIGSMMDFLDIEVTFSLPSRKDHCILLF